MILRSLIDVREPGVVVRLVERFNYIEQEHGILS